MGRFDTRVELLQFVPDKTVKDAFQRPEGLKYGDEMKALDNFCSDYRNLRIPIVNADALLVSELSGGPPASDRTLREYRCIAVAGDDEAKVQGCYAQQ